MEDMRLLLRLLLNELDELFDEYRQWIGSPRRDIHVGFQVRQVVVDTLHLLQNLCSNCRLFSDLVQQRKWFALFGFALRRLRGLFFLGCRLFRVLLPDREHHRGATAFFQNGGLELTDKFCGALQVPLPFLFKKFAYKGNGHGAPSKLKAGFPQWEPTFANIFVATNRAHDVPQFFVMVTCGALVEKNPYIQIHIVCTALHRTSQNVCLWENI